MSALARNNITDSETRAANDDCINGGSCNRTKYTYDVFERLTTGSGPNGSMTYVYNGLGERIVKYGVALADNDGDPATPTMTYAATYFAYDESGHLVGEYNTNGKPREETIYLGDMPIAVIKPAGVYYVHSDYRNTPRQIDNSLQSAVWTWDPRGFGDSNPSQNLSGTTFIYKLRFPGQYFDGETLKNYNHFRTYDFSSGRYLESDPTGLASGPNTYSYAASNPVLFTDLTGRSASGDIVCSIPGAYGFGMGSTVCGAWQSVNSTFGPIQAAANAVCGEVAGAGVLAGCATFEGPAAVSCVIGSAPAIGLACEQLVRRATPKQFTPPQQCTFSDAASNSSPSSTPAGNGQASQQTGIPDWAVNPPPPGYTGESIGPAANGHLPYPYQQPLFGP